MAQVLADSPAKVQPKAAGLLIAAPVIARIPLLKNPGQILRRNANARVPDTEDFGISHLNGNDASRRRVL